MRAAVVKDGRTAVLEVEINPGRANRARVNRSLLPRARDLLGLVRTVRVRPGGPGPGQGRPVRAPAVPRRPAGAARRRGYAGLRADYDRVLKQRNSLLKTRAARRGRRRREYALSTLAVWDDQLAQHGAELMAARVAWSSDLRPYVGKAYEAVARGATRDDAELEYRADAFHRRRDDLEPRRFARRAGRRAARTSSTAGSRWSARTATTCC